MFKKLDFDFNFSGKVIDGEKVGRTIGFPTANLDFAPKNLDEGVYFGIINVGEKKYYCLAYFGPRFIFGEVKNNFEAYIYDFNQKIYDQEVSGSLQYFIRPPQKMKNLDELKSQLQSDKEVGRKIIEDLS